MNEKNQQDKAWRKKFKKETNVAVKKKEETWTAIQEELFPEQKKPTYWKRHLGAAVSMVVTATVVMILIFTGVFTKDMAEEPINRNEEEIPGNPDDDSPNSTPDESEPVEDNLRDQFEDEKQMEIELEGMKELIDMKLAVNETLRYVIYLEKDRYELKKSTADDKVDKIYYTEELDDQYPPVEMQIEKQTNITWEELISNVKETIESEGMTVYSEEEVMDPIEGHQIIAVENDIQDWNDPVHQYYISEVEDGEFFIFKQLFFQEAWEGHAGRFDYMLDTFEYVKEND